MRSIKSAVYELLSADMQALTFVLAFAGFFAAVGILMSDANKSALVGMRAVMPLWLWAALFFGYAAIKLARTFVRRRDICKTINSVLGTVLWSVMLATAFTAPVWDGMKLLYAVPLFCDMWALGQAWHARRLPGEGIRYESTWGGL